MTRSPLAFERYIFPTSIDPKHSPLVRKHSRSKKVVRFHHHRFASNPRAYQPAYQPASQPINLPSNHPTNRSIRRPASHQYPRPTAYGVFAQLCFFAESFSVLRFVRPFSTTRSIIKVVAISRSSPSNDRPTIERSNVSGYPGVFLYRRLYRRPYTFKLLDDSTTPPT